MNLKTNYLLIMTSDKMSVLISGKTLAIKEFESKIGSSCAAFEDLWWLYKMGKWAQIVVSNNTAENTFKWRKIEKICNTALSWIIYWFSLIPDQSLPHWSAPAVWRWGCNDSVMFLCDKLDWRGLEKWFNFPLQLLNHPSVNIYHSHACTRAHTQTHTQNLNCICRHMHEH